MKTTASFKAFDGIIWTQDPNTGERVFLSHKCTELDKQIPSYIAVDLGLSSNYHDIIYQAILVQDNFFEDKRRSYRGFSNKGARIAEGDR